MTSLRFPSAAVERALANRLADVRGNQDAIVGNEDRPAGRFGKTTLLDKVPALAQFRDHVAGVLSPEDEAAVLTQWLAGPQAAGGDVLEAAKAALGELTKASPTGGVSEERWNAFLVDKALTLARVKRDPAEVTERFVPAAGSVAGERIEPRYVFTQRWAPLPPPRGAPPSGKTIVMSPGFQLTGRASIEQIQLANAKGHEVVVMDHQWGGLTHPANGGIDRGFGIARDVAAVVADVAATTSNEIVLMGTSMGAAAGVLGAVLMNEADEISLSMNRAMPKGLKVVLQGPYFDRRRRADNEGIALLGHIPFLNRIPAPGLGKPVLSRDQASLRLLAQHATTEEITGQAQAFHASTADLATMRELVDGGLRHSGPIEIIASKSDTLASFSATKDWAAALGAHVHEVNSDSHVYELHETERALFLGAFDRLGV